MVVIDPQNDFLSPEGVAWGVVGESVTENGTVENIERLFQAAEDADAKVFVSPHYYYPHDHNWEFEGALEALMHDIGMFDRKGPLDASSVESSGADWLERYKPYINDGETVVVSPHKVYGPNSNDLALQLRKAGISQIVLAGMSANLCVESHMRNLIEEGFEVAIVSDATAAAKLPGYDGFEAAFVNYRMIASDVWSTDEAVEKIAAARGNLVNISAPAGSVWTVSIRSVSSSESPRNGSPMIRAEHAGATYLFASEQNRERFLADPDHYAPSTAASAPTACRSTSCCPSTSPQPRSATASSISTSTRTSSRSSTPTFEGSVSRANANWPGLFDGHAQ